MHPLLLVLFSTAICASSVLQGAAVHAPAAAVAQTTRPFAPGERAEYRASWGAFSRVGSGVLTLTSETLRGEPTLGAHLTIAGGFPGVRIDERLDSWMDTSRLASRQFTQRTRYPRFARDRDRSFDVSARRWSGHTNARADSGALETDRPLDELSFLFVVRTLALEVGRDIVLNDYWKPESNPVLLKVLRREVVTVPAGTYRTIVVRPIIKSSGGMFAEKGEAEVYFSEGANRELVMMKAKLQLGTLVLQLEKYAPGTH